MGDRNVQPGENDHVSRVIQHADGALSSVAGSPSSAKESDDPFAEFGTVTPVSISNNNDSFAEFGTAKHVSALEAQMIDELIHNRDDHLFIVFQDNGKHEFVDISKNEFQKQDVKSDKFAVIDRRNGYIKTNPTTNQRLGTQLISISEQFRQNHGLPPLPPGQGIIILSNNAWSIFSQKLSAAFAKLEAKEERKKEDKSHKVDEKPKVTIKTGLKAKSTRPEEMQKNDDTKEIAVAFDRKKEDQKRMERKIEEQHIESEHARSDRKQQQNAKEERVETKEKLREEERSDKRRKDSL